MNTLANASQAELEATVFTCRVTRWQFQPVKVEIHTFKALRFAWVTCSCCDNKERPRTDPHFDAANPGVHLVELTPMTPPPLWRSRWHETKLVTA